ncbi:hypothetical protein FQA39_LY18711 [Lamprigera yunnana]|nr:hypothetical protein FQA39_LY18711 [Lamprigera yunnana]
MVNMKLNQIFVWTLCLNFTSGSLEMHKETNIVKECVNDIMKNVIAIDTTVVYVSKKRLHNVLPEQMNNPFLIIDGDNEITPIPGNKNYDKLIIFNMKDIIFIKRYLKKMEKNGMWNLKSSFDKKFLITYPLEKIFHLKDIFSGFLKFNIYDVIVIAYDFGLKNKTIRVFSWNPYDPSNECGKVPNRVKEETCSSVRMLQHQQKWINYNKCAVTYFYGHKRNWNNYSTEIAYTTRFILDIMSKTLNLTVLPTDDRNKRAEAHLMGQFPFSYSTRVYTKTFWTENE